MDKFSKKNLELFIKFIENQQNLSIFSSEEMREISNMYRSSRNNEEQKNIIDRLSSTSSSTDREKIISEYLNEIDLSKNEDQVLSQIYEVDTSEIEHKFLEDGTEIIVFYCDKLNRNIVFEKEKNGLSLKEQIEALQNENNQVANEYDNTDNVLERERIYGNAELDMIPINKIENYRYLIDKLPPEKLTSLNYMLEQADELHLETINIENVFAMTNKDYGSKIYEAYYDVEQKKVIIEQPEEEKNELQFDGEKNTNRFDEQNTTIGSSEDETRKAIEEMSSEEMELVQRYREYPELLEVLSEIEQRKYQQIIRQMEKQEKELEKPKVYVLKNDNNRSSGFVDAAVLAFITEFIGLFFTTIVIWICSK